MKKIKLSEIEKIELKKLQKSTKDTKIHTKITVILGLDKGLSYSVLSKILSMDENTIRNYKTSYLNVDLSNYLSTNHKGYFGKLTSKELAVLSKELQTNLYSTSKAVMDFVYENLGVIYKESGIVALLHRLNFVYKKTSLVPSKADKNKQEDYLYEFTLLKSGLKSDEKVYFGDGVHPQHNTRLSNAWIYKGDTRVIKSNTGRTRININGVLDPDSKEFIYTTGASINAENTIELYKKIESKNLDKRKIYIIVDNARYYKNKAVSNYLKTSKIEQIFLPTYSPNLNLIERLWKFMYKKVINNKYYEKAKEFQQNICDFFDNLDIYKEELDTLLTFNFRVIGAT